MAEIKLVNAEQLDADFTAIADAIRAKNGSSDTYSPGDMAAAIGAIETGGGDLPEEAYLITGDCSKLFANNKWSWFIDLYGNKVTTTDITSIGNMFYQASNITNIPFELNCKNGQNIECGYLFYECENLLEIPKINNCKLKNRASIFYSCRNLREIPEDIESWFDWSYFDSVTSAYDASTANTFTDCYSLRKVPTNFLLHANPIAYHSYTIYYSCFSDCYALDEILNIPFPHTATYTSNIFSSTFRKCQRVKNITFALQEDGTPYKMNWKSQTIDLANCVGWAVKDGELTDYNSGITADKEVKDDATYQALKDNPDWFTCNPNYSRYNHDSAVNTINSLPDTSAYLATAGGTNTIKFKGDAGSSTDGGAINTLTEEEIAVATAKGWTVTFA